MRHHNRPSIRIQFCRRDDRADFYRLSYRRGQMHFGRFATRAEAVAFRAQIGPVRSHCDITAACHRVAAEMEQA
jgi:hypothetical protein